MLQKLTEQLLRQLPMAMVQLSALGVLSGLVALVVSQVWSLLLVSCQVHHYDCRLLPPFVKL